MIMRSTLYSPFGRVTMNMSSYLGFEKYGGNENGLTLLNPIFPKCVLSLMPCLPEHLLTLGMI